MAKKTFRIKDKQGNDVDYVIPASRVVLDSNTDLDEKIGELDEADSSAVKKITFNGGTPKMPDEDGNVSLNQAKADWTERDGNSPKFIEHKPDIIEDVFYEEQTRTFKKNKNGTVSEIMTLPEPGSQVNVDTQLADSDNPVANRAIKAAIDSLQNALNTLIGSGNVQGAIDTFNEVKAFLDGIDTDDPTLANQLLALNNAISAVQTSLAAKANSADVYTKAQADAAIQEAVENLPTGDIPTKVSELENDEGYITAEEVVGLVIGSNDMGIAETNDYIDIFIYEPAVTISPEALQLDADNTSKTIKVAGVHLKAGITINVPNGFTATCAAFEQGTTTIPQSGGVVAETNVTITYVGTELSASGNITATSGIASASIPLLYSQYSGPTILVDNDTLQFNAGAGSTKQRTLHVTGLNLEDDITLTLGGTNASKFEVLNNSIDEDGNPTSADIAISYKPVSGDTGTHSATLTLSSSGATSKVITLNGVVSTLSVSKQSVSFSNLEQGETQTDTLTIVGANLDDDVSIVVNGDSVFTASLATISPTSGSVNQEVTIQYHPMTGYSHSGTLVVSSSGLSVEVSLSGTATAAVIPDENGFFLKNGIMYGIIADTNPPEVAVWNKQKVTDKPSSANMYGGAITIPATVTAAGTTYNVTTIEQSAFRDSSITALTLPEGLEKIKRHGISGVSITSITIPSTVTSMGGSFLRSCSRLVTVNMLCYAVTSPTQSWNDAYNPYLSGCSALTSFVIPDNVSSIMPNSFQNCTSLRSITLGKNLSVFNNLLNNATGVTEIICRGTDVIPRINADANTTYTISQTVFENATLKVPRGYKQAYLDKVDGRSDTTLWSGFTNIEEYDLTD